MLRLAVQLNSLVRVSRRVGRLCLYEKKLTKHGTLLKRLNSHRVPFMYQLAPGRIQRDTPSDYAALTFKIERLLKSQSFVKKRREKKKKKKKKEDKRS